MIDFRTISPTSQAFVPVKHENKVCLSVKEELGRGGGICWNDQLLFRPPISDKTISVVKAKNSNSVVSETPIRQCADAVRKWSTEIQQTKITESVVI